MKTKTIAVCAVFAAVLCVFSVITIPIGIIPITLGTFGIMLTSIILGAKRGAAATAVFILLGIIGLPVFSGFKSGIQVIAGPTGGYVWSYIPTAVITGVLSSRLPNRKFSAMLKIFAACIPGIIICHLLGAIQFMLVQDIDFIKSIAACSLPFIPFDLLKAVFASYIGFNVRNILSRAGLL